MLSGEDISVVVAGPMGPFAHAALASVRQHLPGSELILSSWRGSVEQGTDADVIVENTDPGPIEAADLPRAMPLALNSNFNRMLRSACNGLSKASRPYALKLRTDVTLSGRGFLDWWDVDVPRAATLRVFDRRVLTIGIATRPSHLDHGNNLFHPSDCVHFGETTDLRRLWSVPEVVADPSFHAGIANEQALWIRALHMAGYATDYLHAGPSDAARNLSECSIITNFTVLETWQFGVKLPKLRRAIQLSPTRNYLWLREWRALLADGGIAA